jgi:dTDP-4-dehydrorhamnose 3,5-epimerase
MTSTHTRDEALLERTLAASIRDRQTVTPEGVSTARLLHGMSIHRSPTHTDDRGTLTEMLDPRWGWHPDPIVYAYFMTERPGHAKGWALHKQHEDRYYLIRGETELVLYDVRPESPTRGEVCKLVLSDRDHFVVNIPAFVWHASRTLGGEDAIVVNFPTRAYDHADPDKYRLPLDTPLIPYSFGDTPGR